MTPYLVPAAYGEAEFFERKSRFIGYCRRVVSEEDALTFIGEIRTRHRDASHNVYCYRLREGNLCRHSDNGEPSGTAGLPLLEPFLRREVYNFACVATRYFGGILLGGGGLVRAYARTGVLALEAAGLATVREWRRGKLTLPYALYESALRLLGERGAEDLVPVFAESVTLSFRIPSENSPDLERFLTDGTNSILSPQWLESEWI